jgi:hypothetical protein
MRKVWFVHVIATRAGRAILTSIALLTSIFVAGIITNWCLSRFGVDTSKKLEKYVFGLCVHWRDAVKASNPTTKLQLYGSGIKSAFVAVYECIRRYYEGRPLVDITNNDAKNQLNMDAIKHAVGAFFSNILKTLTLSKDPGGGQGDDHQPFPTHPFIPQTQVCADTLSNYFTTLVLGGSAIGNIGVIMYIFEEVGRLMPNVPGQSFVIVIAWFMLMAIVGSSAITYSFVPGIIMSTYDVSIPASHNCLVVILHILMMHCY